MNRRTPPVFLQRQSYRRRRAMDALRLLPVLGMLLFAVPMLWPEAEEGTVPTSVALVYIFSAWGALIVIAALFSAFLRREDVVQSAPEEEEGE
jgi:formate hydrogenlyase subunit 4